MSNNRSVILSYIISISFIFAAFLSCVHYCCFDEKFYTNQHNNILLSGKHISEYIGISDEDLKELTTFTLDYLNDPKASLDKQMVVKGQLREVYTDDEKAHMVDVRSLNLAATYLMYFSIATFFISLFIYFYKKYSKTLLVNSYIKVLIFILALFAILGIYVLTDFNSFWNNFHHVFFRSNNLWILDLRKDILIMIVPPEFFNHLVKRILLMFIIAIILFPITFKVLRKLKIYD